MSSTVAPAPAEQRGPGPTSVGRRVVHAVVAAVVGLVAVLIGASTVGGAVTAAAPTALPEAGLLVQAGAPVVTLVGRVGAVGTVGALLLAAVLLPGRSGDLTPPARRAVAAASVGASVWAAATALGGLLTVSRLVGVAPTALDRSSLRVFLGDTGAGRAVVLVVALTGVVAVAARRGPGVASARLLLGLALAALVVPVVLSGHSSAAEDHVVAVTTLGVHVVAASLWVGGLGALLWWGRGSVDAVGRFSALALLCCLATAVSGVLAAVLVLGGTGAVVDALGSGYGALLVAKTLGLTAAGVLGWQHRRRTLPRLRAGQPGAFRRLAVVELAVLLTTVALAVALAASPPPFPTAVAATSASAPAGSPAAAADPMAGHDHGELSVGVLVDDSRFHVAGPVAAGQRVTVHNGTDQRVTITADDGSFDVEVPGRTLLTFLAPEQPGEYRFTSRHSATYTDVLVVQ
ncbi:CopD family protein [Modestobacter italicus]|uniref:CopD family protein n=1 Tax=Modestobacter italicus (strain DSM 44449 / CECT 9708 / BC 501) TaxID=2732864 RepID=UPI001C9565F6|nr:CopD family protein [Modestobacter italicus]